MTFTLTNSLRDLLCYNTGYNPACGVCAMLRGGYVLWSDQNAITVSKQLDFK